MTRIMPLRILEARAEARAILFREGQYETALDAVADLYVYAQRSGLIKKHGDATVIKILERAFAPPEKSNNETTGPQRNDGDA